MVSPAAEGAFPCSKRPEKSLEPSELPHSGEIETVTNSS